MNQKIITKLTEDIYKSAENRTKPFYKYQRENRDKLLLEIAKILLTHDIINEYLNINNKDKKNLRSKLNKVINEYSNSYDDEVKDIETILSDSSKNKYLNLIILLGVILKIKDISNMNNKVINKIEKAIRDKYSTGASQTRRLVEYEVSRCQSEVNEYFFKTQGIIKVMYCADLDSRTCNDCSIYNGLTFYVNEPRPSLPQHCFCRCEYIPVI